MWEEGDPFNSTVRIQKCRNGLIQACLTDLARAGWDIHEIAAFAGHRSLASTLQYLHVRGRELSSKLATTMNSLHTWRVQQLAEVRS